MNKGFYVRNINIHFIALLILAFSPLINISWGHAQVVPTSNSIESYKSIDLKQTPAVQISGPKIREKDLKSSVLLVDFWASWCSPCLKALPYYNDLYKKWKHKGLIVIAINLDENPKDRDNFLKTTKLDFPIFADGNPKYFDLFDVQVVPTLYILNKNKQLIKTIRGFSQNDKKEIENILKDLQ